MSRPQQLQSFSESTKTSATETSMLFEEHLTFENWKLVGAQITQVQEASLFWLGDWLNAGKVKYGTKYRDALVILGDKYEYQSLANIAFVCSHVLADARKVKLTFSHHREVCGLPPAQQKKWLDQAIKEGLSAASLRKAIRNNAMLKDKSDNTVDKSKDKKVNVSTLAMQFKRYERHVLAEEPVDAWPVTRVKAVLADLTPMAKFYVKLQSVLKSRE